jgi:hypothetical protein
MIREKVYFGVEKAMVFSWKTKVISQRSYIDDFLAWIGKFLIGAKG